MTDSVGKPRSSFRIRPYTVTGGRTRTTLDLSIDTVLRTRPGGGHRGRRRGQRGRIVELCATPTPLAELAGRLGQPLQVVSILVGDLLNDHSLERVVASPTDRTDVRLLERVLDGLQGL